eukprot:5744968-Prymnesium_polylepis.2
MKVMIGKYCFRSAQTWRKSESRRRTGPRHAMPRLVVDEAPQHGTATGAYVENAALAARRAAPKRRASPTTASEPKKKKKRAFPSPQSQGPSSVGSEDRADQASLPKKKRTRAAKDLGIWPPSSMLVPSTGGRPRPS